MSKGRLARAIYRYLPSDMQMRAMRLHLAWQRRRHGYRRAIDIRVGEEGGFIVDDGLRTIRVVDFRQAGEYERGIAVKIDEVAARYGGANGLRVSSGAVIVDIGANVGEFALWAVDSGATLIALEPATLAFSCLKANIDSSRNAKAYPLAAWNFEKSVHFYTHKSGNGGSLFGADRAGSHRSVVDATPVDSLRSLATLPRVDMMKISASGAEPEILQGARRTLRITGLVVVDVTSPKRPNLRHRVAAILESMNFNIDGTAPNHIVVAVNRSLKPGLVQYPRF